MRNSKKVEIIKKELLREESGSPFYGLEERIRRGLKKIRKEDHKNRKSMRKRRKERECPEYHIFLYKDGMAKILRKGKELHFIKGFTVICQAGEPTTMIIDEDA